MSHDPKDVRDDHITHHTTNPYHLVHVTMLDSDAPNAKQRYDGYNEKATDHLAKKNEERAVIAISV